MDVNWVGCSKYIKLSSGKNASCCSPVIVECPILLLMNLSAQQLNEFSEEEKKDGTFWLLVCKV